MIIAGWINTFWALLQFFGKDPYFVTDIGREITGERVFISAFTGNPNFLAPFLLFCLILSGFMLATAASMQIKIVHCLSAALLFVGILISQTMATLICMPVIALILGIAFMRAGHVSGLKVTATVLGVVLLISGSIFGTTLLGGEFHNRVMTWVRSAKLGQIDHLLNGRYFLWLSTWEMILDKPFLGHGLATLRHNAFRYQANVPDLDYFEFTKQYFLMHEAHNDYLQVWAETGLVGLCLLLAGLGIYSRRVWRYHCTGSEFGEGKQETLGEKTAEKAQSILAKDRRLFAGAWTTIVLAGMANALANFPLYLSNLLVILAMALAFSARFTGLWPAPPVNRTVQQPSGRLMRLLLAAGLTCLTLLTCLWLLPPYQALRLQRPIKATLERLADLRVARKADTALSLTQAREAVKEAERAVKLDPWSPENHLFLALAYFYNFQFERASMAFERACFLKNEQVLCANWGASLAEMGDFANGRRKLGLAMLFNPFQMQARDTLRKIGEYRDGVAYPPLTWLHYPELAKPTH
jgi:O-antigen ligase